MHKTTLYRLLTYAGALPFIASAFLLYSGYTAVPLLGEVDRILTTYALVIVSFMCGVHWGTYLHKREACPINLFITSNVITLTIWFGFLLWSPAIVLLLSMAAFGVLLWIDLHLYRKAIITKHYFQMRRNVTLMVIFSLLAAGAML